ncbi:336_t:CDS:2, partial [Cetraspora pellucida]
SLYEGSELLDCKNKDLQTIQHADSKLAKNHLLLYNSFFSELVQIQTHLEDFSLYKKHYNQLTISDFLWQQAHTKHTYKMKVEKNTCEIGIQTDKINNMSYILENDIFLLQAQLNIKVSKIENLKKQLEYAYDYVVESWR